MRCYTLLRTVVISVLSGLAWSVPADAAYLYVSNFNTNSVLKLDADTGTLLQTYTAPGFLISPAGLALSPDGSRLYVTATNTSNFDAFAFDVATGARVASYNTNLVGARGLALSADGSTLEISGVGTDNVYRIDTATGTSAVRFSTGLNNPQGIELSPDGASLYIANSGLNNVVQRDLATGSTIRTFNAPASFYSPSDVLLSPNGGTLYVSTFGDGPTTNNQILRYSTADGSYLGNWTVLAPISDLYGLAQNTDGSTLFVADAFNNRILKVDTATGASSVLSTNATLNGPSFLLYTAVPEPGSVVSLLLGGAGCLLYGRRVRGRRGAMGGRVTRL